MLVESGPEFWNDSLHIRFGLCGECLRAKLVDVRFCVRRHSPAHDIEQKTIKFDTGEPLRNFVLSYLIHRHGVAANMRDKNKINDLKKAITTLAKELRQAIEEASYRAKQPKIVIEKAIEDWTFSRNESPLIEECDPDGTLRRLDLTITKFRKKLQDEEKKE